RPLPLEVHLQSFGILHFPSLMIAMAKPAYLSIVEFSSSKPVVMFVLLRVIDRFLNIEASDLEPHLNHITDSG
ncbi:hypothetical protein BS47DRAFT_1255305, partial [Hydnum rufescens UP504]